MNVTYITKCTAENRYALSFYNKWLRYVPVYSCPYSELYTSVTEILLCSLYWQL